MDGEKCSSAESFPEVKNTRSLPLTAQTLKPILKNALHSSCSSLLNVVHPPTETTSQCRQKPQWKKLRRLAKDDAGAAGADKNTSRIKYLLNLPWSSYLKSALIGLLLATVYCLYQDKNFLSNYRKHFNQVAYGKGDYCDYHLDTQKLFTLIRLQQPPIIHQEEALQQLELALRNESNFLAIAIVGPSGVGKSLWARSFEEYFPWRQNVRSYAWNTFVPNEVDRFRMVRLFAENLSDCGRNLLVIENLSPCDNELVPIMNKLITEREGDGRKSKYVVVVYIFNMNSMESAGNYEHQLEVLQHLPGTRTVNFKNFGLDELKDCIRNEALAQNLALTDAAFEEIVASVDPMRSGCKTVPAKVSMYGQPFEKQ